MPLGRIVLHVKDVESTEKDFEVHVRHEPGDRIVGLVSGYVADVEAFAARCKANGLSFGSRHEADGCVFTNERDPSGNPISISSRAFRKRR